MNNPNAILTDSTLLAKDERWNIRRYETAQHVKVGGVKKGKIAQDHPPNGSRGQFDFGVDQLEKIIREKISQTTRTRGNVTAIFQMFDCPQTLQKQTLARKLEQLWGVKAQKNDLDGLYAKWGTRGQAIKFNKFLEHVVPADFADEPGFRLGRKTNRARKNPSCGVSSTHSSDNRSIRRAKAAFMDRLGQSASFSGRSAEEELRLLLRKRGLNTSGQLSLSEFSDLLMLGLNMRGKDQEIVRQLAALQDDRQQMCVFDLLLATGPRPTNRVTKNRLKSTRRAARDSRQRKVNAKVFGASRGQFSMPQLPHIQSLNPLGSSISAPGRPSMSPGPVAPRGTARERKNNLVANTMEQQKYNLREDIASLESELGRHKLVKTQRDLRKRIRALEKQTEG
jgi:hypothetical protein